MADGKRPRDPRAPLGGARLSEAEILQLLEEAVRQYEECMRLADLADVSDSVETIRPKYDWDNPIGIVVRGRKNAELEWSYGQTERLGA